MYHEEYCDEDHSPFDKCNTFEYKEDIGYCMCGRYGKLGEACVRTIDGNKEECGQFV